MPTKKFLEVIKEIQENDKEFQITPRELLEEFECEKRTKWNLGEHEGVRGNMRVSGLHI